MNAAVARSAPSDELDRRRLEVVAIQSLRVKWQIWSAAVVVACLAWSEVPRVVVLLWLVAVVVTRELRVLHLQRLLADKSTSVRRQMPRIIAASIVLGATQGSASLFMIWLDPERDALLTMIMISWAAGAVSTTAPIMEAYLAYSLPMFLPAAAMWFANFRPMAIEVALLILMFALVQFRFARQNAIVFEESFQIRLEKELLVQELATARDAAQSANEAKSRFLAVASHDLRQPLHALTLHSGLLAQDPNTSDAPQLAREISASIDSMAKLLDSLLDISRLDAGVVVVERRRIVLGRLITHLTRTHQSHAVQKGIDLFCECPPDVVVETDPLLLERLLRNLLDNAIKYTERGRVGIVATGTARIDVEVRDSGCGIAAESQSRVFEEFFQCNSPSARQSNGLGLGLAIVRRLANLLELPLMLESEPGCGTVVRFSLQRAPGAPDPALSESPEPEFLRGLRVLIVDDQESVRRATAIALERFGCETDQAANTRDALVRARERRPQLVIVDYRLGDGEDGIAAIEALRRDSPGLPGLLVTGDTGADVLRAAEQSGLLHVHKPLTLTQLRAALLAVLESTCIP